MATATSVMRVQQVLLSEFDSRVRRARADLRPVRGPRPADLLPRRRACHVQDRRAAHGPSHVRDQHRSSGWRRRGSSSAIPTPKDGRGTLASITPAGREVIEAATADLVAAGFGLTMLDATEQEHLFRLLRKVRAAYGDFQRLAFTRTS